jgi:hypothetical protein
MKKLFLVSLILAFFACSKKQIANKTNYTFAATTNVPLYSNLDYWAAHPAKKDMSDNAPKGLAYTNEIKQVDVFFIHPTSYTDAAAVENNANINDAVLNKKTDDNAILFQASVFNESCNVFAPRYRQAHYRNFFTANQATAKESFDIAYADVKTAFEYYLQHHNQNKPIIIASHSQGTLHAGRLLKEFFENKPLGQKLVCAYIIGLPVNQSYFSVLQPCNNATQTNCFVTWRTFKTGYPGEPYIQAETEKVWVTNPLTWRTDSLYADRALNKGAILRNFKKVKNNVADAQVHNNILWTQPKFFGANLIKIKNYHIADYNFYYVNIRENVKERIAAFWKQ